MNYNLKCFCYKRRKNILDKTPNNSWVKVHISILRRPQNFAKSSPYFWRHSIQSKVKDRLRKILWHFQNIWTLQKYVIHLWKILKDRLFGGRHKAFTRFLSFISDHDNQFRFLLCQNDSQLCTLLFSLYIYQHII